MPEAVTKEELKEFFDDMAGRLSHEFGIKVWVNSVSRTWVIFNYIAADALRYNMSFNWGSMRFDKIEPTLRKRLVDHTLDRF